MHSLVFLSSENLFEMVRLPTLVGAATLALSKIASAKYALANSYDATNFFDGFEFRNGTGSGGFAQYVDAATAEAKSLARYT